MKIFLDTNILVFGLLTPFGPPQDLEMMRAGAEFVLNNHTDIHRIQTILDAISARDSQ